MMSITYPSLAQSTLLTLPNPRISIPPKTLAKHTQTHISLPISTPKSSNPSYFLQFTNSNSIPKRGLCSICYYDSREESKRNLQEKETGPGWPVLKRWEVPWGWQTVSLTSLACAFSFILAGSVEVAALPYLGIQLGELTLDGKAEILFVDQAIITAVVLAVIFSVANRFQPLPSDILRYDLKEPFNLEKGWLLWAGIGLVGAIIAIAVTGAVVSLIRGENPERETDALVRLLPLIGSSSLSTACLVGITGVLAPVLEETVFRGFFMVSLTKWVPTPVSVLISASVFALAHLTPGEFPQLFVLGFQEAKKIRTLTF